MTATEIKTFTSNRRDVHRAEQTTQQNGTAA